MEEERKQISKRVEKAEQKARALPNFDALNQAAKRLRLERQKSEEIQMQIREQRTQLGCPLRLLNFFCTDGLESNSRRFSRSLIF